MHHTDDSVSSESTQFAKPDRVDASVFSILDVLLTFALTAACPTIRVQCVAELSLSMVQTTLYTPNYKCV